VRISSLAYQVSIWWLLRKFTISSTNSRSCTEWLMKTLDTATILRYRGKHPEERWAATVRPASGATPLGSCVAGWRLPGDRAVAFVRVARPVVAHPDPDTR